MFKAVFIFLVPIVIASAAYLLMKRKNTKLIVIFPTCLVALVLSYISNSTLMRLDDRTTGLINYWDANFCLAPVSNKQLCVVEDWGMGEKIGHIFISNYRGLGIIKFREEIVKRYEMAAAEYIKSTSLNEKGQVVIQTSEQKIIYNLPQ